MPPYNYQNSNIPFSEAIRNYDTSQLPQLNERGVYDSGGRIPNTTTGQDFVQYIDPSAIGSGHWGAAQRKGGSPYDIANMTSQFLSLSPQFSEDPVYHHMGMQYGGAGPMLNAYSQVAANAPQGLNTRGVRRYYHMTGPLGFSEEKAMNKLRGAAGGDMADRYFSDPQAFLGAYPGQNATMTPEQQAGNEANWARTANYGPSANMFGGGSMAASRLGSTAPSNVTNAPSRVTMMPDTVYSPTQSAMRTTAAMPAASLRPSSATSRSGIR